MWYLGGMSCGKIEKTFWRRGWLWMVSLGGETLWGGFFLEGVFNLGRHYASFCEIKKPS